MFVGRAGATRCHCPKHFDETIDSVLTAGWERPTIGPPSSVLSSVAANHGLVTRPIGTFDDPEAGIAAFGTPTDIHAITAEYVGWAPPTNGNMAAPRAARSLYSWWAVPAVPTLRISLVNKEFNLRRRFKPGDHTLRNSRPFHVQHCQTGMAD